MTRFLGFAVVLCVACGSGDPVVERTAMTPPEIAGPDEPVSRDCTPDGACTGCSTCFEECRCGGGAAARCSEACSLMTAPPDGEPPLDPGGDPVEPPFRAKYSATFISDAFDLGPGEEAYRCQNFANPFGTNVAVVASENFMTSGSHHMFAFHNASGEVGELEPCSGLEFGSYFHSTQRSQEVFVYPEGVGRWFGATEGLRLQVHYLNPTTETVTVEIAVTLHAEDFEDVEFLASHFFMNTFAIDIQPYSKGTVTHSCGVPDDIKLFTAASHMHQRGVYFTARDERGQLLYETDDWAEPAPWYFDPPRELAAGGEVTVECEYENNSAIELGFGDSAATDEMCIFSGNYFPAKFADAIQCLF